MMLIKIYFFDPANHNSFSHFDLIKDDAPIPANATTIAPFDNAGNSLLSPSWSGTSWVGVDKATWLHNLTDVKHDAVTVPVTDTQITLLTAELLQTKKTLYQQGQQITALTATLLNVTKANK